MFKSLFQALLDRLSSTNNLEIAPLLDKPGVKQVIKSAFIVCFLYFILLYYLPLDTIFDLLVNHSSLIFIFYYSYIHILILPVKGELR